MAKALNKVQKDMTRNKDRKSNDSHKDKLKAERKKPDNSNIPGPRSWLGNFLLNFGARLTKSRANWTIGGLDNIPADEAFVIVANHVTFIDALWILKSLPQEECDKTCAMIGADLRSDYGLLGKMMFEAARAIPVDRKGTAAARSLIIAKNAMAEGNNILIHPEGTRSRTGELGKFESGAAYLAHKYKVPILPVYIKGGHDIWPPGQKLPSFKDEKGNPKNLSLVFGKPIRADGYAKAKDFNADLEKIFRDYQATHGY